jgi:uncharacterized protein GlcG (DUF336 family)
MQNLATKFIVGVAVVAAVGMSYALINQLIKISTLQTLSHNEVSIDQALLVAQGAIDKCRGEGAAAISVAVVDGTGGIRYLVRGDGASPQDLEAARRKAYTARTFRQTTSAWIERTAQDALDDKGNRIDLIGQRFLENTLAEAGGVPLLWHNDAIGGVGVKGAKDGATDEVCAQAGADAIKDQLL